jgi:hypothetical protein
MSDITDLGQVTESRLCWPENKPRSAQRTGSAFKSRAVDSEQRGIEAELERWRIRQFIISRNNQRIYAGDPAAAVWWLDRKGVIRVLACDKYTKLADNMHAIRLTLEAMRALERWGAYTAEQAAEGARLALPAPVAVPDRPWREILGVAVGAPGVVAEAAYRVLAKNAGEGSPKLIELNLAIEAARRELR